MLNDFDTVTITRAESEDSGFAVVLCRKNGHTATAEYEGRPKDEFNFEVQAIEALIGMCSQKSVGLAMREYYKTHPEVFSC